MAARTLSLYTFLLAIVLALGACKKDDFANETIKELSDLTDEIVKKVKDASDKKAGVAEAQKALDAKKADLSAKMKEIGQLRGFQLGEEAQGNVAKGIIDATSKMAQLEIDLLTATMSDKELEAAVEKLAKDHKAILDALTEGA
jgi:hypothetical protein